MQAGRFKYISCYCLSIQRSSGQSHPVLFKYISCYCLSQITVTLIGPCGNSNTSHVIVYLFHQGQTPHTGWIQIHLMLLFIAKTVTLSYWSHIFKYISCYCLSSTSSVSTILRKIQIHLMLLFIRGRTGAVWGGMTNSNTSHVIVYLSYGLHFLTSSSNSNTSHVIVYLPLRCGIG